MSSNITHIDISTTSGTYTVAPDNAQNVNLELTLSGNLTIACPDCVDGAAVSFVLKQDATGGRTVSWSSDFRWGGGRVPVMTTSPSAVDTLLFSHRATAIYLMANEQDLQST